MKGDKTGKKFSRLKVVHHLGVRGKNSYWMCICDCGNEVEVSGCNLKSGQVKSCGCLQKESYQRLKETKTKHGMYGTQFYLIHRNLNRRCNKTNSKSYSMYGGRGIKCEWKSFEEFKKDMYETYLKHVKKHGEKNTTIERIDNNGNYSKENCKWATRKQQANNTRRNVRLTYDNKTKTLSQWSSELGLNYDMLKARVRRGWSDTEVLKGK